MGPRLGSPADASRRDRFHVLWVHAQKSMKSVDIVIVGTGPLAIGVVNIISQVSRKDR
jgi:hypothetical protein